MFTAMSLCLYIFADVHVCDHMQIYACLVYICMSMCVCMEEKGGWIHSYLLFMKAAAALSSSVR